MSLNDDEHALFRGAMISLAADSPTIAEYVRFEEAAAESEELDKNGSDFYHIMTEKLTHHYGLDQHGAYEAVGLYYERNPEVGREISNE